MKIVFIVYLLIFSLNTTLAQSDLVTYAGNNGKECFYDVMQISDGTFLVCGYADDLDWIDSGIPRYELSFTGNIPNALGTGRYGFILHLSKDMKSIKNLVHFPKGIVEDIRFMKTNSMPYTSTGDLFISCNTSDTDDNDGGYIIAQLDYNFIDRIPSSLVWFKTVWAKTGPKEYHPWDVTNDGKIYYISGDSHGYDWSAVYRLDRMGRQDIVNDWRTHWLKNGQEWRGSPASANPLGSIDSVSFSGIVLKIWGRCDLRSWSADEYNAYVPDGNGSYRKGTWPLDILFNAHCDPNNPTAQSPGYSGYSASGTPVYGGSCIQIDRRNNDLYIGMNFKSVLPGGQPDFEPAVIAMDSLGRLKWWSRLYHEITTLGDTVNSSPDQYVDALAIDYKNDKLVVGARCHGNNVENFWAGNRIKNNASASGFQNNFTGNSGNIHISWLGKLALNSGELTNSTYMAELAEGTNALGMTLTDPNLSGWPDPNQGWPNLNTTRMAKNSLKISGNGDVCVLGVGRRTITTANAYQQMVKPGNGGLSCWNSFVRVYDDQLTRPKYSSLVVGIWDTLNQQGGDNTELFGVYKTREGVIAVGKQKADINEQALGNDLPVINVPLWGRSTSENETAVLVYYQATNLYNEDDGFQSEVNRTIIKRADNELNIFPNPANDKINISFNEPGHYNLKWKYKLTDNFGRIIENGDIHNSSIQFKLRHSGLYYLQIYNTNLTYNNKIIILN